MLEVVEGCHRDIAPKGDQIAPVQVRFPQLGVFLPDDIIQHVVLCWARESLGNRELANSADQTLT